MEWFPPQRECEMSSSSSFRLISLLCFQSRRRRTADPLTSGHDRPSAAARWITGSAPLIHSSQPGSRISTATTIYVDAWLLVSCLSAVLGTGYARVLYCHMPYLQNRWLQHRKYAMLVWMDGMCQKHSSKAQQTLQLYGDLRQLIYLA